MPRQDRRPPRPGELPLREAELRRAFLREVERIPGGDRLRRCIQCGTCSGSCPVSYAMDIQPRQLIAHFRAGDLDAILRSRTIWLCASCYACTVRCPAGIRVTDLIYALKRMALEDEGRRRDRPVHVLSRTFVSQIRRRGRSHEIDLVLRYTFRTSPLRLLALLPLGWRLARRGRLPLRMRPVKDIDSLRRIIARAERMEAEYPREAPVPLRDVGYGAIVDRAAGGAR